MTTKCTECMKDTYGLRCGTCSCFNSQDAEEDIELSETAEAALLQDLRIMVAQ